jgi:hypothetical protein
MNTPKLTGNRCQCTACGDVFNSTTAFDRHRVGDYSTRVSRQCQTSAELIARGWSHNAAGFWITESRTQREARQLVVASRVETHRAPHPATTLQATP